MTASLVQLSMNPEAKRLHSGRKLLKSRLEPRLISRKFENHPRGPTIFPKK
jgi:hypothetical protein